MLGIVFRQLPAQRKLGEFFRHASLRLRLPTTQSVDPIARRAGSKREMRNLGQPIGTLPVWLVQSLPFFTILLG